jgi:hypothetical protein
MKTCIIIFAGVLLPAGVLYYLKYSRIAGLEKRYMQHPVDFFIFQLAGIKSVV